MAQYQALVEYKRVAKGTTSVHNMKEFVSVGMKNVQLAKGRSSPSIRMTRSCS